MKVNIGSCVVNLVWVLRPYAFCCRNDILRTIYPSNRIIGQFCFTFYKYFSDALPLEGLPISDGALQPKVKLYQLIMWKLATINFLDHLSKMFKLAKLYSLLKQCEHVRRPLKHPIQFTIFQLIAIIKVIEAQVNYDCNAQLCYVLLFTHFIPIDITRVKCFTYLLSQTFNIHVNFFISVVVTSSYHGGIV